VLALALALVAGCTTGDVAVRQATPAPAESEPQWPQSSEPYRKLVAMRDGSEQSAPRRDVAVPKGIDASQVAPLAEDDPARSLAELPLDRALELCVAERPEPIAPPPAAPAEAALVRAQRLYASGVAKLLAGDLAGAARDLTGAAQLDPSAAAPWLRLGEAQAALGQSPAALLSYKKAADLGADDALALTILGMQSSRAGQHSQAAHYLARALGVKGPLRDPLLRNVALVHASGPLRQLGYLRASIDATVQGLSLSDRAAAPSRFRDELTTIAQRASDLWRDVGDTASRLEDDRLAAEAYAKAASLPNLDPSAILARRVYVLLRDGQDAAAAILLLDDIAGREGRADARHLGLLGALRTNSRVGALTSAALADLRRSMPGPLPRSTASAIVMASAAVAPPREARDLLLRHLAAAPDDEAAAGALLALAESDRERVRLATGLVEQAPPTAGKATAALFAWHGRPADVPEQARGAAAGELLKIRSLMQLGRAADALPPQNAVAVPGSEIEAARLEAWGLAAASLGRWDLLESVAAALEEAGEAQSLARVWRAGQRYEAALRALEPALGAEADVPMLLRASELALATGESERAERLLLQAQELDPFDEGSYEGLITIYQGRSDEEKAADTIRALRSRVPSGRVLRWVNAQELARRGMLDEAERSLRELLEDAPDNAGALGLLLQIWQQRQRVNDTASLADATEWLRTRVAEPPYSAEAMAALGRLLTLQERFADAAEVLEEGLAQRPSPALSRALEDVVRARGEPELADQMELDRLANAGQGIDTCLERAELLVRLERFGEAIPALRDAMPAAATLTVQQESRLFAMLGAIASRAEQINAPEDREQLIALIGDVEALEAKLPWQLAYVAWTLLASEPGVTDGRVSAWTESLVAAVDSPELARSLVAQVRAAPMSEMDTLARARGELAYTLGNMLDASERKDAALAAYRTALRYNPDHAWAANDLGYSLVERHERLEEAERLLEHAYRLKPDEPSIADSLGWLRYKLGQWEDQTLPDGTKRPGAVSLLTSATSLPEGDSRGVIHDHLGDALWRAGERARAEAMWARAQQLLVGQLVQIRDGGSSAYRAQLTETQGFVGDKLDALRAGREPVVAPLLGGR
jgi:tetratricopeptide (TPR) repeat protein